MKNVVIGSGQLANALKEKLEETGWFPTPDTETVFYMSGPTDENFDMNPEYHMNQVIQDFLELLPYCKRHNIRFVYTSSAKVYEKDNNYTKYKRALEMIAGCYPRTLGLRIFPVYGGTETRTAIYKWCEAMKNDKRPTVYGDGSQKRDFIHIDDAINQILILDAMKVEGMADVGTGTPTSFNDIIKIINTALEKNLEPVYIEKPKDYSEGIYCKLPLPTKITIYDGIRRILGK